MLARGGCVFAPEELAQPLGEDRTRSHEARPTATRPMTTEGRRLSPPFSRRRHNHVPTST
jgi:hypothetical protein